MTLKEMKERVLSLIEEIDAENELLTDDPDIQKKINYVIDTKNHELARIKKIPAIEYMTVDEDQEFDLKKDLSNFYKLSSISGVDYDIFENFITFKESGDVTIKYYKYPKIINNETKDDEYKFETTEDVLEIMPLGIAADLLKNDVSAQYGQLYANAYKDALNMLDIKINSGKIRIVGGI